MQSVRIACTAPTIYNYIQKNFMKTLSAVHNFLRAQKGMKRLPQMFSWDAYIP